MANSTYRVFKTGPSAGAIHNKACAEEIHDLLDFDIHKPADKAKAIDYIASELFIVWGDDPAPGMTDLDVAASVTAEAEEIYQAWLKL